MFLMSERLNCILSEWQKDNILFCGLFHSHIKGQETLSKDDIEYIQTIFSCLPLTITELYFPIVISKSHIISYQAVNQNHSIRIMSDTIDLVPWEWRWAKWITIRVSRKSNSPAEKCADTIVQMDVFIGILTTEIPMADSIAAITDITTIPEKDRAAFRIKDNKFKQYISFALHIKLCAELIF